MIIRYVGYFPEYDCRSYTFEVREDQGDQRIFTLSVNKQALSECKFKDQDIPDLCYAKMKRELALETKEQPLPLAATISGLELRTYLNEHYPARKKSFRS